MCIFCKIINNEIPSYKIYEDDDVLAILDISQATLGHTLVMPKKHYENIFEADNETIEKVFKVVKIICDHYKKTIPDLIGLNVLNNNGEKAGQTVNHLHIHIIPRYPNDDLNNMTFINHQDEFNLKTIQQKLEIKSH